MDEKIKVGNKEYTEGDLYQLLIAYSQLLIVFNVRAKKMRYLDEMALKIEGDPENAQKHYFEYSKKIKQVEEERPKAELPDPKDICWD